MPDRNGRIKGVSVPRVPWHEDDDELEERDEKPERLRGLAGRVVTVRGDRVVEIDDAPTRETR